MTGGQQIPESQVEILTPLPNFHCDGQKLTLTFGFMPTAAHTDISVNIPCALYYFLKNWFLPGVQISAGSLNFCCLIYLIINKGFNNVRAINAIYVSLTNIFMFISYLYESLIYLHTSEYLMFCTIYIQFYSFVSKVQLQALFCVSVDNMLAAFRPDNYHQLVTINRVAKFYVIGFLLLFLFCFLIPIMFGIFGEPIFRSCSLPSLFPPVFNLLAVAYDILILSSSLIMIFATGIKVCRKSEDELAGEEKKKRGQAIKHMLLLSSIFSICILSLIAGILNLFREVMFGVYVSFGIWNFILIATDKELTRQTG